MKLFVLMIALLQGLLGAGALALLQAIVLAFVPAWELPFSPWWGLLLCLPGLAMAYLFHNEDC